MIRTQFAVALACAILPGSMAWAQDFIGPGGGAPVDQPGQTNPTDAPTGEPGIQGGSQPTAPTAPTEPAGGGGGSSGGQPAQQPAPEAETTPFLSAPIGGNLLFTPYALAGIQYVQPVSFGVVSGTQLENPTISNPVPISPVVTLGIYLTNDERSEEEINTGAPNMSWVGMAIEFQYMAFGFGRSALIAPEMFCTERPSIENGLVDPATGSLISSQFPASCRENFSATFHTLSVNLITTFTNFGETGLYLGFGAGFQMVAASVITGDKYARFRIDGPYAVYQSNLDDDGFEQVARDANGANIRVTQWGSMDTSNKPEGQTDHVCVRKSEADCKIIHDEHFERLNIPLHLTFGWHSRFEDWPVQVIAEFRFWFTIINPEIGDGWRTHFYGFGIQGGVSF